MARRMPARLTKTSRTLRERRCVLRWARRFGDGLAAGSERWCTAAVTPFARSGEDGSVGLPGCGRLGSSALARVAGVHEEVDVALAVAELDVSRPWYLSGRASMALARKVMGACHRAGDRRGSGELAGAGAQEVAANADVVAEVEQLVEREGVFADVVLADVDLEALAAAAGAGRSRLCPGRGWP